MSPERGALLGSQAKSMMLRDVELLGSIGGRQIGNALVNLDLRRAELALGRGEHAVARERLAEAAQAGAAMDDALDRPSPAAIMKFREAEAHVNAGDRLAAATVAAEAHAAAAQIGAAWLRGELEGPAAPARLQLAPGDSGPDPVGEEAAADDPPHGARAPGLGARRARRDEPCDDDRHDLRPARRCAGARRPPR